MFETVVMAPKREYWEELSTIPCVGNRNMDVVSTIGENRLEEVEFIRKVFQQVKENKLQQVKEDELQ